MRLYYMTDEETALLILRDHRLKLSLSHEMNDPFELIAVNRQHKHQRQIAKILKSHWAKAKGAICTSDNWKSPVLVRSYIDEGDLGEDRHPGRPTRLPYR